MEAAPAAALADEKGNSRAGLTALKDMAGVWVYDDNGKPRASLDIGDDGPGLVLADEEGVPIWSVP